MDTPIIEFTTGKRGKENVIVDGFRYSLDRKRASISGAAKSYWKCTKPGCSGRLVLHDKTLANEPVHNHADQKAEITVHKAKKLLKQRAVSSNMTSKHIAASTVAGLNCESRAKLGCTVRALEKMAQSARRAARQADYINNQPDVSSSENLCNQPYFSFSNNYSKQPNLSFSNNLCNEPNLFNQEILSILPSGKQETAEEPPRQPSTLRDQNTIQLEQKVQDIIRSYNQNQYDSFVNFLSAIVSVFDVP